MAKIFSSAVQQTVVTPNSGAFTVQVVSVPTAGTPVNLPSIVIPDGKELIIRAKLTNGFRKVFLSDSAANVANANTRIELRAGESIGLAITNANLVWIDGSSNGVEVELMVEL